MLITTNLDYASTATILFQRFSVIVTELLILFPSLWYASYTSSKSHNLETTTNNNNNYSIIVTFFLVAAHPGLIIVDNIHFQYNGMLLGLFLVSIALVREGNMLPGAAVFAVLLNMKHIFMYASPAYFVYLLRHYCFEDTNQEAEEEGEGKGEGGGRKKRSTTVRTGQQQQQQMSNPSLSSPSSSLRFRPVRFLLLAFTTISIFTTSFAPFILTSSTTTTTTTTTPLHQILGRLFPVGRGLLHAYWAPNIWALYAFTDRCLVVLIKILVKLGTALLVYVPPSPSRSFLSYISTLLPSSSSIITTITNKITTIGGGVSLSSGIIGADGFSVLPSVGPLTTTITTVLVIMPILIRLWNRRPSSLSSSSEDFTRGVMLCTLSAFLFGFHVHEKAILMVLIPMAAFLLDVTSDNNDSDMYVMLNTVGIYSLFPLVFRSEEYPIKVGLLVAYTLFTIHLLLSSNSKNGSKRSSSLSRLERMYLMGLIVVEIYGEVIHKSNILWSLGNRLPFLPLMMTSVYCSVGVVWVWWKLMVKFLAF